MPEAASETSGLITLITAIAALVAAFAAVVALGFTAYQIRRARLAADLQALTTFFSGVNERERALFDTKTKDEAERRFAFFELLNFLELYAFADNKEMMVEGSRLLIAEKIADSIVAVERSEWHHEVRKAITSSDTFNELAEFIARHKDLIKKRRDEADRKEAEELTNVR